MKDFSVVATDETIESVSKALEANGIRCMIAETGNEAKEAVLGLIPKKAEVMTMTSVTLDRISLSEAINESGDYDSVRNKLNASEQDDPREKARLGAAPEWAIGSVHAITGDGHLFIASNTGSQLAAEVYGAPHVVFVAGAQKIVDDHKEALQRIYEYTFPLEDKRAMEAYGINSFVSKLLIINREVVQGRITVIIVKEPLGF